MLKKIIKIVLIGLLVLIVAAFAMPYLFKGQIVTLVKKEINKKINAKVDFKDVDISFFRHFPKVAVGLDDLQVICTGVFAVDTLVSAKRIDAALNIMSVINGKDITIYSVSVESPSIHAIINKDSLVNWDIMKPDTAASAATGEKPFKMALQQYGLQNAYISYKDETAGIGTEIFNLNHDGSGDFTSELFTLKTSTSADAVTVTYGGVAFLSDAKVVADADIQVDNKNNTYRFTTDKVTVNALKISGEGSITNLAEKFIVINTSYLQK
jgi:hypothetical protein